MLTRERTTSVWLVAALWMGGCNPLTTAHEGPPFPLLMDEPVAEYKLSIWADPDIGEAKFYIIVETATGHVPLDVPGISLWTEPLSGRLERATYPTQRQPLRNRMQFLAKPTFDQRDLWSIGFQVATADSQPREITTQVESTPPGFGAWDLAIYLFPFLLIGGLWFVAVARRRIGRTARL